MKLLRKIAIIAVIGIVLISLFGWASGQYNSHTDARISCENQLRVRDQKYDKSIKVIAQQAQVGKANDSSFQKAIRAAMENRKDGEGLMMKWVTESNPVASQAEVTRLYEVLMRSIEVQREIVSVEEQKLSDLKAEDDRLMRRFPGNILHKIYGTQPFAYKPITSSRTQEAARTGIDDDVKVF